MFHTCQPNSDWWKINTPPPTPGEHDGEEREDEEDAERDSGFDSDEGELDSVGLLFHALIENNISVELCSRFVSHFCNPEPEDNPANKSPSPCPSHSPPPVPRKRSYNIVAKVPYSRFKNDPRYSVYTQYLMQDTVTITSKEAETRDPSRAVPNAAGILNTSNFLDPDYQKTPSASHLLAGKFRTPKSHSLSDSATFSVSSSDGFQINAG